MKCHIENVDLIIVDEDFEGFEDNDKFEHFIKGLNENRMTTIVMSPGNYTAFKASVETSSALRKFVVAAKGIICAQQEAFYGRPPVITYQLYGRRVMIITND